MPQGSTERINLRSSGPSAIRACACCVLSLTPWASISSTCCPNAGSSDLKLAMIQVPAARRALQACEAIKLPCPQDAATAQPSSYPPPPENSLLLRVRHRPAIAQPFPRPAGRCALNKTPISRGKPDHSMGALDQSHLTARTHRAYPTGQC